MKKYIINLAMEDIEANSIEEAYIKAKKLIVDGFYELEVGQEF